METADHLSAAEVAERTGMSAPNRPALSSSTCTSRVTSGSATAAAAALRHGYRFARGGRPPSTPRQEGALPPLAPPPGVPQKARHPVVGLVLSPVGCVSRRCKDRTPQPPRYSAAAGRAVQKQNQMAGDREARRSGLDPLKALRLGGLVGVAHVPAASPAVKVGPRWHLCPCGERQAAGAAGYCCLGCVDRSLESSQAPAAWEFIGAEQSSAATETIVCWAGMMCGGPTRAWRVDHGEWLMLTHRGTMQRMKTPAACPSAKAN